MKRLIMKRLIMKRLIMKIIQSLKMRFSSLNENLLVIYFNIKNYFNNFKSIDEIQQQIIF
jgi:hypothetical protein